MRKLSLKIFMMMTTLCLLLSGCGQRGVSFSLEEQFDPKTMSFPAAPWGSSLPEVYEAFGIEELYPSLTFSAATDKAVLLVTLTDLNASGQMQLGFEFRGSGPQLCDIFLDLSFADEKAENAFWEKYSALALEWAEENEAFQGYLGEEIGRAPFFSEKDGLSLHTGYRRWAEENEDLAFAYGGKWRVQLSFLVTRGYCGNGLTYW